MTYSMEKQLVLQLISALYILCATSSSNPYGNYPPPPQYPPQSSQQPQYQPDGYSQQQQHQQQQGGQQVQGPQSQTPGARPGQYPPQYGSNMPPPTGQYNPSQAMTPYGRGGIKLPCMINQNLLSSILTGPMPPMGPPKRGPAQDGGFFSK